MVANTQTTAYNYMWTWKWATAKTIVMIAVPMTQRKKLHTPLKKIWRNWLTFLVAVAVYPNLLLYFLQPSPSPQKRANSNSKFFLFLETHSRSIQHTESIAWQLKVVADFANANLGGKNGSIPVTTSNPRSTPEICGALCLLRHSDYMLLTNVWQLQQSSL